MWTRAHLPATCTAGNCSGLSKQALFPVLMVPPPGTANGSVPFTPSAVCKAPRAPLHHLLKVPHVYRPQEAGWTLQAARQKPPTCPVNCLGLSELLHVGGRDGFGGGGQKVGHCFPYTKWERLIHSFILQKFTERPLDTEFCITARLTAESKRDRDSMLVVGPDLNSGSIY